MAQPLDTVAVALYSSLTAGTDFDIPEFDLSGPEYDLPGGSTNPALDGIAKLTNGDLTNAVLTGNVVTGTGTMDVLMNTFMLHLDREYSIGHITGAEYTKAYIASMQVAAGNGVQYLVQRDQAYWAAVTAQMGIINSRIALAIAKTQLAATEIDANTSKVRPKTLFLMALLLWVSPSFRKTCWLLRIGLPRSRLFWYLSRVRLNVLRLRIPGWMVLL